MFNLAATRRIKKVAPPALIEFLLMIKYAGKKLENRQRYEAAVRDKSGIEIGGPSTLFKTVLPLYQIAKTVSGVNFASNTVWEGSIRSGQTYRYFKSRTGQQFISDAVNLSGVASDSYDFLLSSNCLEHIANPLKALAEWRRVLRDGAAMVLVLPNSKSNFDHRRPLTKFEHLVDDHDRDMTEHDLTHLDEIIELHDLSKDRPAGDKESFRKRSLDNFNNRTLHHHVFDLELMKKMLVHAGFDVHETSVTQTDLFALAIKRSTPA